MITLGCDYNPEQWPPGVWAEDAALMRSAGIDLVAINVFGWSDLEPRPGEYDFTRLDAVVDLLHAHGIRINLGTGTASPPPWLTAREPEILPVAADGTRRWPGGRQAWCPSSPAFRQAALALVEQVAKRYGRHPAVALWHVSNELGCHNALCYCDLSAAAFRGWLRQRYGTVDALNVAWGTSFWSQRYADWAEILPPRAALSLRNPAQMLDFRRFSSDELLGHYAAEAELLRRHGDIPVTTNFMVTAHIRDLDYWRWAPHVDVVANDHYLDHRLSDPAAELSFAADLTRGLAGGRPWMLMEQSAGAVNWQPHNVTKRPGEMLRNTLTQVARGADAVCFFQWRASAQGAEKFHSALVPHAGTDTARWREVLELSAVLDRIGEVAGSRVVAGVALLFSWESWWAVEGEGRPSESIRYLDQVHAAYGALRANGTTTDICEPGGDLSRYRLVVVPCLHLVDDRAAAGIAAYVRGGGRVLITFYSGIVDQDDRVRLGGYPGAFRDLLGVTVEEFAPLLPGEEVTLDRPVPWKQGDARPVPKEQGDGGLVSLEQGGGGPVPLEQGDGGPRATLWTERLRTTTADPVARYADGPLKGTPAITRNRFGDGEAWYVATALEPAALRDLIHHLTGGGDGRPEVEAVRRRGDTADYLFLINHGDTEVACPATGRDLVSGETFAGETTVPPGGVRVLVEEARP